MTPYFPTERIDGLFEMSEYRLTFGATLSMAGVIDPEEVTDDVFLGGILLKLVFFS